MIVARRVRVSGRVQGVFFRAWTRDEARALGVHGWVRNCDDGSVAAFVEGEEHAVNQLLALMRDGPAHAKVEEFSAEEAEPEGHQAFEVRH
jgi:acylphosphatase